MQQLTYCLPLIFCTATAFAQPPPETYAIDSIRRFADTFERVREYYVEEIGDEDLLNLAIHGMLEGLDPHSAYLEPDQLDDLKENTHGTFSGLGLEIDMDGALIRVVAPIDDSPAATAGIKAGDLIIKLDDTQVRGLTLNQAVDTMRGEKGTAITLTILRDGAKGPLTFKLVRDIIQTVSVKTRWLEPGYAYVRIASFQLDTGEELHSQLEQLGRDNIKALILDLRNNPGGVLTAAVAVSDTFLDSGTIVYTEGRASDAETRYQASPGDRLQGKPIVVLLDRGSASASEIVAGALQDNHRAVIAGQRSFGKGSVQRVLPLSEGYAIKLTTSLYFTPSGRSIQAHGIQPDIDIPVATVTPVAARPELSERTLPQHIELEENEIAVAKVVPDQALQQDNQLAAALNIAKGAVLVTEGR